MFFHRENGGIPLGWRALAVENPWRSPCTGDILNKYPLWMLQIGGRIYQLAALDVLNHQYPKWDFYTYFTLIFPIQNKLNVCVMYQSQFFSWSTYSMRCKRRIDYIFASLVSKDTWNHSHRIPIYQSHIWGFPKKWWYPPISHLKCWSFLVGKPMVVGETHLLRKHPYRPRSSLEQSIVGRILGKSARPSDGFLIPTAASRQKPRRPLPKCHRKKTHC